MLLLGASTAAFSGDLPDEHWRCGPYRITIVPGPDYSREQNNQFEDYIVIKNGKPLPQPHEDAYHRRRCPIRLVGGILWRNGEAARTSMSSSPNP